MPIDLNEDSGFIYGRVPPIHGIITDSGIGKTRLWREAVALPLIKHGLRPALAIPLHQLGEEIVADLEADGIVGFVYRGREADDPNAPGHKMCREQERIGVISQALGSVSAHACKRGNKKCRFFDDCSYQRQQHQRPEMWVFAHQLLFHRRPDFMPHPDALAIDESFWQAGLRGDDRPEKLWLCSLKDDRYVPRDIKATADLVATSDRVHAMLMRESAGFIRRGALIDSGITVDELRHAWNLEWRRKKDIKEVDPGIPIKRVYEICEPVMAHNQEVRRLATLWELLIRLLEGDTERSAYLDFRPEEPTGLTGSNKQPAVRMIWRADIHSSWHAPTTVMDATMQPDIVRQYLPRMPEPVRVSAPTPHISVRQVIDRSMSSLMLIPKETRREKYNQTARNNDERVREYIEVRANEVRPGRVLVICQLGLEIELKRLGVPDNVDVQHFGNIVGKNAWNDITLLIVIGRTDPGPQEVEKLARALFGADIAAMATGSWYPKLERGVQMRDGGVCMIETPAHPDPRVEAVRWSICEGQLMQAIGRGRAVNRSAENPLQIDIVTNVPLRS